MKVKSISLLTLIKIPNFCYIFFLIIFGDKENYIPLYSLILLSIYLIINAMRFLLSLTFKDKIIDNIDKKLLQNIFIFLNSGTLFYCFHKIICYLEVKNNTIATLFFSNIISIDL